MIMNDRAIELYRRSVDNKEFENELILSRDVQIRQAKEALENYRRLYKFDTSLAYKAMLLDDNLSLSALFRYCTAKLIGDEELASLFLKPAAGVYAEGPELYDKIYTNWITDELKRVAGA
jgi:hypothetical protein